MFEDTAQTPNRHPEMQPEEFNVTTPLQTAGTYIRKYTTVKLTQLQAHFSMI